MRLLKAKRKWTPVLVTICVILLLTLYIIDLTTNAYCTYWNAGSWHEDSKPARDFHPHAVGSFEGSFINDIVVENVSDFHNDLLTQFAKYKSNSGSGILPHAAQSDLQSQSLLVTETAPLPPTTEASNPGGVLDNVSFADLMRVVEDNNLESPAFLNWTKTYQSKNKSSSFEIPRFIESGSKVCDHDTEMIIIIPAVPEDVIVREVVRQTWASSLYNLRFVQRKANSLRTKIAFTFGTNGVSDVMKVALKREALRYNDIVVGDFIDSYRNLSLKMMVSFNWIKEHCSSAKYVLKVDLDTYVNLPLLSRFLRAISERVPQYILGHKHSWHQPPVLRTGKWKVDQKDYPFEIFPPYVYGHSYVITADLIPSILAIGQRIPLISTEDAHITGVLAHIIRAPRIHYGGFASNSKKPISCRILYNKDMSVTKMSPGRLVLMWRDILTNVCSDIELPPKSENVLQWEFASMLSEDERRADRQMRESQSKALARSSDPWKNFWNG